MMMIIMDFAGFPASTVATQSRSPTSDFKAGFLGLSFAQCVSEEAKECVCVCVFEKPDNDIQRKLQIPRLLCRWSSVKCNTHTHTRL